MREISQMGEYINLKKYIQAFWLKFWKLQGIWIGKQQAALRLQGVQRGFLLT